MYTGIQRTRVSVLGGGKIELVRRVKEVIRTSYSRHVHDGRIVFEVVVHVLGSLGCEAGHHAFGNHLMTLFSKTLHGNLTAL